MFGSLMFVLAVVPCEYFAVLGVSSQPCECQPPPSTGASLPRHRAPMHE